MSQGFLERTLRASLGVDERAFFVLEVFYGTI
jgi:hypothetical protein